MADNKLKKSETKKDTSEPNADTTETVRNLSEDDQIGKNVAGGEVTINREEYLQAHKDLLAEKNHLQMKNSLLQRRLAEYYKKRKLDHVLKPVEQSAEFEEKYNQKLLAYEELKEKQEKEIADIQAKVRKVEEQYEERLKYAENKFEELQSLERATGTGLIYSKKGKPIADKTVHRFLILQKRKQEQSSALCLRFIRARNAVAELDAMIRDLEMLGPGLYVAQYEQLYVDKQNYLAKIEEKEDELIKNRAKCTEHNQMLAHIREKMHHTEEIIDFTECDLGDAEMDYLRAREDLGWIKTKRDKLRWALQNEKVKAGLLTKKELLYDFQIAAAEVVMLREKKKRLEEQITKASMGLQFARHQARMQREPSDIIDMVEEKEVGEKNDKLKHKLCET